MTTFYLIRHGQTEWNVQRKVMGQTDTPLNITGEGQAKALGEAMKGYPLDAIYASPQLRARQTAEAVGKAKGLSVYPEPALAEVDFAGWIGASLDDLQKDPEFKVFLSDPRATGKNFLESTVMVQKRVVGKMEELAEANPNGTFALVSHADPIRAAVSDCIGQPVEKFRRIRIANASVSVVIKEEETWRLTLLNFRPEPDLLGTL